MESETRKTDWSIDGLDPFMGFTDDDMKAVRTQPHPSDAGQKTKRLSEVFSQLLTVCTKLKKKICPFYPPKKKNSPQWAKPLHAHVSACNTI